MEPMKTPLISNARVISVDVPNRRLWVTLPSTQIVSVRMSYEGAADGLRVNHKAMPGRGTEGIVVFPGADNRNGFWLKSIYAQASDALTTDTDQFLEYDSHWSGHFHMLDGSGNFTESFADGSFLQVGSGTTVPPTSRHTVDSGQNRQVTPLSQSERVPNPPSPFNITLSHISGTKAAIDPSGNTTVSGAAGATLTMTFGGATLHIDAGGNVTVTASSVVITAPSVAIGSQGETLHTLLTSLAANVFNSHTHGTSGPPTPQMTTADETSVLTAG
jgi:phage baseplate assembly protein gpV